MTGPVTGVIAEWPDHREGLWAFTEHYSLGKTSKICRWKSDPALLLDLVPENGEGVVSVSDSSPFEEGPYSQRSVRLLECAGREQCRDLVRKLDIPDPWDFEVFCELLQERRGRPLEVLPILPVRAGFPNGLFLSFDTVDRIYMVKSTTSYHREHIALHEIGHLLLGHRGRGLDIKEAASVLFPNLDPALVQMILGRSGYSDPQERQAEYFASLVLARADEHRRPRPVQDPNVAEVLGRLEASWGPAPRQGAS